MQRTLVTTPRALTRKRRHGDRLAGVDHAGAVTLRRDPVNHLVADPLDVVRVCLHDGYNQNAGHLVRMFLLDPIDEVRDQGGLGVVGDSNLVVVLNSPFPSVNRANRGEMLSAGDQAFLDQLATEGYEPLRIVGCDYDFDDLAHADGPPFESGASRFSYGPNRLVDRPLGPGRGRLQRAGRRQVLTRARMVVRREGDSGRRWDGTVDEAGTETIRTG